jgi:hypothetical protein
MQWRPLVLEAVCAGLLLAGFVPARGALQKAKSDDKKTKLDDRKPGPDDIDRADSTRQSATGNVESSLTMSRGVVCSSIDGYEIYDPLPDAALTSDEKLLVYYRPGGYKSNAVDGGYQAHFTQDAQIRKRGQKAVLRQKLKLLEYKPKNSTSPPQFIYLRNSVSLKGLPPGDYDLLIILHDEVAKPATATQIVKFRVIPAQDPRKMDDASPKKAEPSSSAPGSPTGGKARPKSDDPPPCSR